MEANDRVAAEEELSEEDQQLKNELDLMVERLTVRGVWCFELSEDISLIIASRSHKPISTSPPLKQ
jgi:hypothetical protein